ncbi:hypothetical protein K1T71_008166 [Dendrolimus kikuchii]|uniref:Uncharacterized protein n=1 Tax=Dendrolimus kikuchii TaxID=765133 RepID=A0ACC1CXI6_9NEOP|nr:hypothetical protein K1T71_008166 [Dendrolimus kikuchii]
MPMTQGGFSVDYFIKRSIAMALVFHIQLLFAALVPVIAEIDMKFIKYPESVTAPVGDTVNFECEVNVPGERLEWRRRTKIESNEDKWQNISSTDVVDVEITSNEVFTKLVMQVKEHMTVTEYQCVVWYGSVVLISVPARLTVARIDLSKNTADKRVITAPLYNTVVMHCKEPLSDPPAVLTWWKEGPKGTKKPLETPHGVLIIHNSTSEDSGTYGCKATNELSGQAVDLPEKTLLKVQHEGKGGIRFLESEDYVGVKDTENVLTYPVRANGALRLWCGAVGTPPPKVTWSREGKNALTKRHENMLTISPFSKEQEGIYSCSANGIRRSWKVYEEQLPQWEGSATNVTASEGGAAHVYCGTATGNPPPIVHWVLNAELIKNENGVTVSETELNIEHAEKRHAGIVQCFACNRLGCTYDAAMLTIIPLQISDQDYSVEVPKTLQFASQPPKRHNRKNSRKHKAVLIPPSRPNVTRLSDQSVMVSWSNANQGLPIQFFKVQYREATNSSSIQWNTCNQDIPAHIHSYEIDGLTPDKYYRFRIAAVYSNQDNKQGRSSARFYLQKGGFQTPNAPILTKAEPTSPTTIKLDWTWLKGEGVEAEGFYVYYRAVSSAGAYEKVIAPGAASTRSIALDHLQPDTPYELKVQAYTSQAPSDFSSILVAKTHRAAVQPTTSSSTPGSEVSEPEKGPSAVLTAGGAVGAAALIIILVVTLLLCRRAKRHPADKEKGSVPETGSANGYIPAKVPITITANPMHSEAGDACVEMSFLHNNNTGNNDDTLPHSRKNGPARQYV